MEKPLNRKNYGSIPHLSSSKLGEGDHFIQEGQERILTLKKRDKHDNILVFEKYDGSNVGVCRVNNEIQALTRNGATAISSPFKQHHVFHEWVKGNESLFDFLNEGERVVGEWLFQAHGLKYKINGAPIIFFDYFDESNNRKLFSDLSKVGLPLPRLLHQGDSVKPEELLIELNNKTERIKSYKNPEGMIYRVERKGKVDFLAKWVRPDFKAGVYIVDISEADLTYNEVSLNL